MRLSRSIGWTGAAIAVAIVLVVGAGSSAALCKLALDCGFGSESRVFVEDYEGVGGGEIDLPDGLRSTTVARGFEYPSDFDFFPDGRIVVAEKDGLFRLVEDGELQERPFLDLRPQVNTYFFRGVMDVTVDPDFERFPFVYVVYSVRAAGTDPRSKEPTIARVSRFRVDGDVAVRSSEQVVVGKDGRTTCADLPTEDDCLPAQGDHVGGDIAFLPDDTMFVATGDGGGLGTGGVERQAFAAQDLDSLGGKVLHVDRAGRGLPSNPYWTGDADANRSKVWAQGFRNPFRLIVVPAREDVLLVADVGAKEYEEIDAVSAGTDHGWPCREGPDPMPVYESHPRCIAYEQEGAFVAPWLAMPHPEVLSITGGVTTGSAPGWPEEFADRYLFGDWGTSELFVVPLDVDAPAAEPESFATNSGGPVAFRTGVDGGIYYLALNVGELRRIAPG